MDLFTSVVKQHFRYIVTHFYQQIRIHQLSDRLDILALKSTMEMCVT
jgi:hypothetical protein